MFFVLLIWQYVLFACKSFKILMRAGRHDSKTTSCVYPPKQDGALLSSTVV